MNFFQQFYWFNLFSFFKEIGRSLHSLFWNFCALYWNIKWFSEFLCYQLLSLSAAIKVDFCVHYFELPHSVVFHILYQFLVSAIVWASELHHTIWRNLIETCIWSEDRWQCISKVALPLCLILCTASNTCFYSLWVLLFEVTYVYLCCSLGLIGWSNSVKFRWHNRTLSIGQKFQKNALGARI